MLAVNKINTYQQYQQGNLSIKPNYAQNFPMQKPYNLRTQNPTFTGNFQKITNFINTKYVEFQLKRVLQEFEGIAEKLDINKKPLSDILSEKCRNLISYVQKKTGTNFISEPVDNNFSKIENLIKEQEITPSAKEQKELLKRFTLAVSRKILINNCTEALRFFKNLKDFQSHSVNIQMVLDKLDTAIRLLGLSKEVKEVALKAQNDLGVKLDIPDSLDLAKYIYTELGNYKKLGHALPEEVSFNDFDFLTKHNPALSANYISGTKPKNYEEIIAKYPSLAETFNKKQITFNPIFLLSRQTGEDYKTISEDLRHEFGHFWHNLEIGDEAFHSKKMNNIDGFLSSDDIDFLSSLKSKLREKVCFITDLNIEETNENLSKTLPDLQNIIEHKQDLEIEDIVDNKVINKFNQIIQKLEKISLITLRQFSDCSEEAIYALTSPNELVAFAIQKSKSHHYSKDFIDILKSIGLPEKINLNSQ